MCLTAGTPVTGYLKDNSSTTGVITKESDLMAQRVWYCACSDFYCVGGLHRLNTGTHRCLFPE